MNKSEEFREKIRILKEKELREKMSSKDKTTVSLKTKEELKALRREMRNYLLNEKEGKIR